MSIEDLRKSFEQLSEERERARGGIVDFLIDRSISGEIKWDFSKIEDRHPIYSDEREIKTEVRGVEFSSWIERGSGARLEAIRDKEDGEVKFYERFTHSDAVRLRQVLEELALEDPVAIEARRQEAERHKRLTQEENEKQARKIQKIRDIENLLEITSTRD